MADLYGSVEYDVLPDIIADDDEEDDQEDSTESDSLVHVSGYTRKNGTYVDDYYRSPPNNGTDNEFNQLWDQAFKEYQNKQNLLKQQIDDIGSENNYKSFEAKFHIIESHIQDILKDWQKYLDKSAVELKNILNRVTNNHDNFVHQKLLSEYISKKENLKEETDKFNFIKFNFDNGKYSEPDVSTPFLQNYVNPLQARQSYPDKFTDMYTPTGNDRSLFNIAKSNFVNQTARLEYPLSTEFAHNSLTWLKDVSKSNPNAVVLHSVKDASNPQLQLYLQDRIHNVLYLPDSRGIFYNEKSDIAREIALSPEFQKAILDNVGKLLKNQVITLVPLDFKSNSDLANSLGHASIYKAWIDNDKNLNAIIYDIYDFDKIKNPQTKKEKINNQMYYWQTNNNLENYFVLIFVKI